MKKLLFTAAAFMMMHLASAQTDTTKTKPGTTRTTQPKTSITPSAPGTQPAGSTTNKNYDPARQPAQSTTTPVNPSTPTNPGAPATPTTPSTPKAPGSANPTAPGNATNPSANGK